MQDQPSRLDRIEAAIEADRIANRERFEQIQQQYDNERQLIAELRTRQEIESRQISELRESIAIAMERDNVIRDTLELLIAEFTRHRSDGHGA